MCKRIVSTVGLFILMAILTGALTAAAPMPDTTFTWVQGLPSTMSVGETRTVVVDVTSNQEFLSVQAMPSLEFPGKGVVAVQGGDRAGRGTSARLEVTFLAKSSTAGMPGGVAPVHVVVGVRYAGGFVAVDEKIFNVTVP